MIVKLQIIHRNRGTRILKQYFMEFWRDTQKSHTQKFLRPSLGISYTDPLSGL